LFEHTLIVALMSSVFVSPLARLPDDETGLVHYPDFFRPSTVKWWQKQITRFHDELGFDGMW
jgi:alpha-glucosidase (family GH31 glycosyl hydrolase)